MSTLVPPAWTHYLDQITHQVTRQRLATGLARTVCVAWGCLVVGLLCDGLWNLSPTWRTAFIGGGIAIILACLYRWVARPLWSPPDRATIAAMVERRYPELQERLISLVELEQSPSRAGEGTGSAVMRDLLRKQTLRWADRVSADGVTGGREATVWSLLAALALVVALLPAVFWSSGYWLALSRLATPWQDWAWGLQYQLVVVDGDRVVARGSTVNLRVHLLWHGREDTPPRTLEIVPLQGREERESRELVWNEEFHAYLGTWPNIAKSLDYVVTAPAGRSRRHHIEVIDPAALSAVNWEVTPPAYQGLPSTRLDAFPPTLDLQELAEVTLTVRWSAPVSEATLNWPVLAAVGREEQVAPAGENVANPAEASALPGAPAPDGALVANVPAEAAPLTFSAVQRELPLDISRDGRTGTIRTRGLTSGTYRLNWTDQRGPAAGEVDRQVVVHGDVVPQIGWADGLRESRIELGAALAAPVRAGDDFGLSLLELEVLCPDGTRQKIAGPPDLAGQWQIEHEFRTPTETWGLEAGQRLQLRARVVDNRATPGPQQVWSETRTVTVGPADDRSEPERWRSDRDRDITQLQRELADIRKSVADLHQQATRGAQDRPRQRDQSPEARADLLREEGEHLRQLRRKTDALQEQLAERTMQEPVQAALERADDPLRQAQEQTALAAQQRPREQVEQLSQTLDRLGEADAALEEARQKLADQRRLSEDIGQLNQLAQRADELARQGEELAQQARDLEEQADGGGDKAEQERVQRQRQDVARQNEQLQRELDALLTRRPEIAAAAQAADEQQRAERLREVSQLAERQQQLNEQRRQNADAEAALPPAESQPAGAQPPASAPAESQGAESQGAESRPASQPEAAPPRAGQPETGLIERQREIASRAIRQALELSQDLGTDAPATQSAVEFAESANAAVKRAKEGSPQQSAAAAQQAAEAAEQVAQQIGSAGQAGERATELAQQQAEAAQALAEQAATPEGRRNAVQAAQRELLAETQAARERMSEAARSTSTSDGTNSPDATNEPQPTTEPAAADGADPASRPDEAQDSTEGAPEANGNDRGQAGQESAPQPGQSTPADSGQGSPTEPGQNSTPQRGLGVEPAASELAAAEQAMRQAEAAQSPQEAQRAGEAAAESLNRARQALAEGSPSRADQPSSEGTTSAQDSSQAAEPTASHNGIPGETGQQTLAARDALARAQRELVENSRTQAKAKTTAQAQDDAAAASDEGEPRPKNRGASKTASGGKAAGEKSKSKSRTEGTRKGASDGAPNASNLTRGDSKPPSNVAGATAADSSESASRAESLRRGADELQRAAQSLARASQSLQTPGCECNNPNGSGAGGGRPSSASGQATAQQPGSTPGSAGQPAREAGQSLAEGTSSGPSAGGNSAGAADPSGTGKPGGPPSLDAVRGGTGSGPEATLDELKAVMQRGSRRRWGQLPGTLRTQILQGSNKTPHPAYAGQIKDYFERIAKPADEATP